MWRNFRFQYMEFLHMKRNFSFSTQQMWRNVNFCQIWWNFTFLHRTDVKKSEIYPVFCHKVCFTLFLWDPFWRNLRAFAWRKICKKLGRWRKNDKYQVWLEGGRRRCSSAPGLCRGCVGLTPGILRPTGLLRKLSVPRPTLQSLCRVPTSQTSLIALWARIFVKTCRIRVFLLW